MDVLIGSALKSDYEALCEIIDKIDAIRRKALAKQAYTKDLQEEHDG
jgi:hypothetical protein